MTDLSIRSKKSIGYDDAFMSACQEELSITEDELHRGEYWVADFGGICGCACLDVEFNNNFGEVHSFFIDPDMKRQGIGRLLWNELVKYAKEKKLRKLILDADPTAVPFYQSLGFKKVKEVSSGSIPGRKIPHMGYLLGSDH